MNILNFIKTFNSEDKCKHHFYELRLKAGIVCKHCSSKDHYWLSSKEQWQCKVCKFRTTLKSGTIMEGSKMSFLVWYQTMAFMSFSKKGISAKEMQRQLGRKRYESTWLLMHKIRASMGMRDAMYQLHDLVEMDEGHFRVSQKSSKKNKSGKGSCKVKNTAVFAESTPIQDISTGERSSHCRYFKMKVLANHKAASVLKVVEENVANTTILFSDKSKTYTDIDKMIEGHIMFKSNKETTSQSLRWVHIAIANARRCFDGIYHHMKQKYLQNYLDEFCYKLNRRYFKDRLFDRLTIAVAQNFR